MGLEIGREIVPSQVRNLTGAGENDAARSNKWHGDGLV